MVCCSYEASSCVRAVVVFTQRSLIGSIIDMNLMKHQLILRGPKLGKSLGGVARSIHHERSMMKRSMHVLSTVPFVQAVVDEATDPQDFRSLNQSMREGSYELSLVQRQVR